MSPTLGCSHDHICYGIDWRAALAQAADTGGVVQAVDFPSRIDDNPITAGQDL